MAAVTPLGESLASLWAAIQADRRICDRGVVSEAANLTLRSQAMVNAAAMGFAYPAGLMEDMPKRVGGACDGMAGLFSIPGSAYLDRSIELGSMACLQALADAGWSAEVCAQGDTALIVATSKGPVLRLLEACAALKSDRPLAERLAWHVAMGPAALQTVLTEIVKPGGAVQTHIAACAGSLIALQQACNGIRRGEFTRAVVVAADASIDPIFEHSFDNLGIFAKCDETGHRRCRPFDASGGGFFISEAAAAICLQAGDSGAVEVENCWMGADATHLLAIDPAGRSLARGLRTCAGGHSVAFVHAHAAGTQHDQVEAGAIAAACGNATPYFSHKRWLGHSLGASGLVGLVISTMCHQNAILPTGQSISRPARSITIGQGFGGHIGMCVLAG